MKLRLTILILLFLTFIGLQAQKPCLSGFRYRRPITISNPVANQSGVVYFEFTANEWITAGKLRNNCADIRFMSSDNDKLRYWIDTENDKSDNQGVWVELPSMPAGNNTIYMFYGNVSAVSQADTAVFEFFDHFENVLDNNDWDIHGENIDVSGGSLTIGRNTSVSTTKFVTRNYTTYAHVEDIRMTTGDVYATLGQIEDGSAGFAFSYNYSDVRFEIFKLADVAPYLPLDEDILSSPGAIGTGMWSFAWRITDKMASGESPNIGGALERKVDSIADPTALNSSLSVKGNGEMVVDWIAMCKFNDNTFTATVTATEEELTTGDIEITGTNEFCVTSNDQLILSATYINDAYYTWQFDGTTIQGPLQNGNILDEGTATLTDNGTFAVLVDVGGFPDCAIQVAEIDVIVDDALILGDISGTIDTCELINSGTIQLSNYSGIPDFWEYRILPGSIWNTLNHTLDYYDYSGLEESYEFRAHIDAGSCGSGYTDAATVNIAQTSNGGNLFENADVCYGSADTIHVNNITGDITHWEYRTSVSGWTPVSLLEDTLVSPSLTDSTWYRVSVTSGNCPPAYSNTILRAVNPVTDSGSVAGGKYVCYQNTSKDTLRLTNYTGNITQWEFSITSEGPWSSETNTSDLYIYQGLVNTTYFRALVQSPGCEAKYSQIDTVIVENRPVGGTLLGSSTVCATDNSGQLTLDGFSGKILKWIISADSAQSWASEMHPYDTLSYTDLQDQRMYRVVVNTANETCMNDTSDIATINVSLATEPGSLNTVTTAFCADTNGGFINIINEQGQVQYWESSPNGLPPWSNINVQTDSLEFENLENTTFYRAFVKSGACPVYKTDSTKISIDQISIGGNILGSKEVCEQVNDGVLTLVNSYGNEVNWQLSTDSVSWTNIGGEHLPEYAFTGLDTTTWYRTVVTNGNCSSDTSSTVKIKVTPLPDVSFSADDVNLTNATIFVNSTSIWEGMVQNWFWDFGDDESSVSKSPKHTYSEPGTYTVKLNATSNKGCLDSASADVTVFDLPDVSFNFENVCFGVPMQFNNTSAIGTETNYYWNFGDGSGYQLNNESTFTNNYFESGTYDVTLRAISASGGIDSVTHTVIVYPRATVDFDFENICAGSVAQFTNRSHPTNLSMTFRWDFGNGETDIRTDPTSYYGDPGNYMVTLAATTIDGCVDSLLEAITAFPLPIADFQVEDVPYQQESVFINTSSIAYGLLNFQWHYGDGNSTDSINPIYVYESPGVYNVQLTATSDQQCQHSVEKEVKIFPLPVAKFDFSNVCIGDSMYFINESTIPSGTQRFEWDFGDYRKSQLDNPVHLYEYPGEYTVRMISISDKNARDTVFHDVEVYDLPDVSFSFTEACDGFSTLFTNESTVSDGDIASALWDFGDGTNSVQMNPENLFLNPGVYSVSLDIVSSTGCQNSVLEQVIVHRNPVADFTATYVCLGKVTDFENLTTIDNTDQPYTLTYQWNFGDGQGSTARDPGHEYIDPGIFNVSLKVYSDAGCVDSLKRNIEVFNLPDANAGLDTSVVKGFPIILHATGGTFYEWSPEIGLSDVSIPDPEARPMETTEYTLRVTDDNSCISFDTILVTVEDEMKIIPSNILTPNNNNENDTWHIVNIDSYPEAEIRIFDRWGKMIYKITDYQNDWQGTNLNGDILPDGTYYYIIVLSKEHNMFYKGAITILRDK